MDTPATQQQLDEVQRKLDLILEEIEMQRRHRIEMEELKADLMLVGKDLYHTAVGELDGLDRKGYFAFVKELRHVGDTIVTSFTVEDVKNLGENIVTILKTVKRLTQPDMLHTINNAIAVYRNLDIEIGEPVSYRQLFAEFRSPEMRRSAMYVIALLKKLAAQKENVAHGTTRPADNH
jgi:uncharacterized protein YjgD (DUF1641 family)